jgi:hypothetical protein
LTKFIDEITKDFPLFPRLHVMLHTRPNVVPPVLTTGVGPHGRSVVYNYARSVPIISEPTQHFDEGNAQSQVFNDDTGFGLSAAAPADGPWVSFLNGSLSDLGSQALGSYPSSSSVSAVGFTTPSSQSFMPLSTATGGNSTTTKLPGPLPKTKENLPAVPSTPFSKSSPVAETSTPLSKKNLADLAKLRTRKTPAPKRTLEELLTDSLRLVLVDHRCVLILTFIQ